MRKGTISSVEAKLNELLSYALFLKEDRTTEDYFPAENGTIRFPSLVSKPSIEDTKVGNQIVWFSPTRNSSRGYAACRDIVSLE